MEACPVTLWVQTKKCAASCTVASSALGDTVVDGLHNSPRPCLGLLSFTRKLDLVVDEKPVTNALCSAEVIESIFKLCESEFLLAVGNSS
jgi:hypothetical protein